MKSLLILQKSLFQYRLDVFNELSKNYLTYGIFPIKSSQPQFSFIDSGGLNTFRKLILFVKIILHLNASKLVVFTPAYSTDLFIFISSLICLIFRIPLVVHGQANFKKPNPSLFDDSISLFWLLTASHYICYSNLGCDRIFKSRLFRKKVCVIPNRYESLSCLGVNSNNCVVYRSSNCDSLSLLFVGRNRPGVNLDFLVDTLTLVNKTHNVHLHVISDSFVYNNNFCTFHGSKYNRDIIKISNNCQIGIYPGDAGLSILHYMSLGLCPLAHSDMRRHRGPEPAYISHLTNGILFERNSTSSLVNHIISLAEDPELLLRLRQNALKFSIDLHSIPYSSSLDQVIDAQYQS